MRPLRSLPAARKEAQPRAGLSRLQADHEVAHSTKKV